MPFPSHTGITLAAFLKRAALLLNDDDPAAPHVRWTQQELINYTNEGFEEIRATRPEAFAITTDIPLAPGAIQYLPKDYQSLATVEESINGVRVEPVTKADYKYARVFRKAVRAADFLENPIADYHVHTYTVHPIDDTVFYVAPPVPVGCRVRVRATLILRTKVLDSTDMPKHLPIKPEYQPTLLDWVMHRALSKDHESSTAREQSAQHEKGFRAAITERNKARSRQHDEQEGDLPGTIDQYQSQAVAKKS